MTTINTVRDDVGVYSLKTANATPVTTQAVAEVPPYGQREPAASRRIEPVRDRRRGQRRRAERRAAKAPVILDTRDKHERRACVHGRRAEDRASVAEPRAPLGINAFI